MDRIKRTWISLKFSFHGGDGMYGTNTVEQDNIKQKGKPEQISTRALFQLQIGRGIQKVKLQTLS